VGAALLLLACLGCGAVGDPMPPLVNIPARVTDLGVVQRGQRLLVRWTAPALTTEGFPPKDSGGAVIVGLEVEGDGVDEAALARARELESIEEFDAGERLERRLLLPAQPGRRVALAVRHSNWRGRAEGYSNIVVVEIGPPLATPTRPAITTTATALVLEWQPALEAAGYRVYRSAPEAPAFRLLAEMEAARFADTAFRWEVPYSYFVRAFRKAGAGVAESEDSPVAAILPQDVFPPAPPAGLQAVASETTVDLSWNLSPEPDAAGYHVYRQDGSEAANAPLRLNPELLAAPGYTDREIRSGRRYAYTVAAVDQKGNQSRPSEPATVTAP